MELYKFIIGRKIYPFLHKIGGSYLVKKRVTFISGLSAFLLVFNLLFSNPAFATEGEQGEYLEEYVENEGVTEDSENRL